MNDHHLPLVRSATRTAIRELDGVKAAAADLEAADRALHDRVDQARAAGASWAAIGRTLGVTRQAAWQRFTRTKAAS